uniref:Membrane spanning 4-domains A8 n=1 Tax=Chelonoidis abingdonii TaxID=106734 RepID=A0A8C0G1W0_CHEAB
MSSAWSPSDQLATLSAVQIGHNGALWDSSRRPIPSNCIHTTPNLTSKAIQILIGLMHIGFGGISGAFFGHYTPISFIGGYPFWRGLSVSRINGSSLGKNIISAIFSAIGISLLLTELIINASYRYFGLAATKGITVLLLLFTILEFSIAVSISYFACLAICYTPNTVSLSALKWGQSSDHVLNGGEDACLNEVPTLMVGVSLGKGLNVSLGALMGENDRH